jgi:hypothetical protein
MPSSAISNNEITAVGGVVVCSFFAGFTWVVSHFIGHGFAILRHFVGGFHTEEEEASQQDRR